MRNLEHFHTFSVNFVWNQTISYEINKHITSYIRVFIERAIGDLMIVSFFYMTIMQNFLIYKDLSLHF